jgi:hypothetical protein
VWFWLWTGLIVAWLVGVAWGGRWLWRQLKELLAAFGAAADQASAHLEPETNPAVSFVPTPIPTVAIFAGPGEMLERANARTQRIAARRRRRSQRHQAAYDRWAVLAGYHDGHLNSPPKSMSAGRICGTLQAPRRGWGLAAPTDAALGHRPRTGPPGPPPKAETRDAPRLARPRTAPGLQTDAKSSFSASPQEDFARGPRPGPTKDG